MKMMTTVCASLLAVFLTGSSALAVEHQMEGQKSMSCCQGMRQGECGCEAPMMGRGMGRPEMMGMPMTDMMCSMMHQQMMGGRMGPGGMGMEGMFRMPGFYLSQKDELKLGDEQVASLKKISLDLKKDIITKGADVKLRRLELSEILGKSDFKLEDATAKLKEVSDARLALATAMLQHCV